MALWDDDSGPCTVGGTCYGAAPLRLHEIDVGERVRRYYAPDPLSWGRAPADDVGQPMLDVGPKNTTVTRLRTAWDVVHRDWRMAGTDREASRAVLSRIGQLESGGGI